MLVGSRRPIGKPNSVLLSACSSALLSRLEGFTPPGLPYVSPNHSFIPPGDLVALRGYSGRFNEASHWSVIRLILGPS